MTVSRGRIVAERGAPVGDEESLRGRGSFVAREPVPSDLDLSAIF